MPVVETIAQTKVVNQDPVNFKQLYRFIFAWLVEHEYIENAPNSPTEQEFETVYAEQVFADNAKEYHIYWRTWKQPENKYFRYLLSVDYQGLKVEDVEMMYNDKKQTMQSGEITVFIRGQLMIEADDNKERWSNSFILKTFRNWFQKKWYRAKIEQHEDEIYDEVYRLQTAVKDFIQAPQFDTAPDPFFNPKVG